MCNCSKKNSGSTAKQIVKQPRRAMVAQNNGIKRVIRRVK